MIPESLRKALVGISPYFCFLLAIVTLGPLQFGFHLAELNAPQDVITCRRKDIAAPSWSATSLLAPSTAHHSLPDCIPMSEARFATVSSVYTIGGLIGALAAGPFCSHNGRRPAMAVASFIFLVGSLVETFSASVAVLAVGRVLNGLSAGASTVIVPLYISEVAPPASRGFFGAFTQITVNVGILFVQTLGFFLSHDSAWRFILGTGIIIALINLVGMWGVAESPAWLVTYKGQSVRAHFILQRIRGAGVSIADEVAAWPPSGLQHGFSSQHDGINSTGVASTVPAEEQALLVPPVNEEGVYVIAPPSPRPFVPSVPSPSLLSVGFFKVVTDAHYRPAIIAVIGIMFAQQVCGINSVIMYSVSLLNGMLPLNSALLTIIISAVNLVTTMLCAPLPDRLGRKTCLLVSVVGQGMSSLALAFSIVFGVKILSAFSVLTFVAFFAVGLGPVPFILASELVGQEAVGATQSWALGANYIATFLVAQFFPMVNSALNARLGGAGWVYFLFAGCAALSTVFFWIYVPETKGKKDADEVWGRTTRLD
ncbi:hexose transporter [Ophiostoma piceae UAMH 11346]|uniref:Hexose transporter n=1 Tax=Ophiostoma piceae (strain UAMH 11346) TaxID=1262450 RepID=S3BQL2_OPHP1|nr:hexose transporter [Ophiostoma piceae UAMH 11346]